MPSPHPTQLSTEDLLNRAKNGLDKPLKICDTNTSVHDFIIKYKITVGTKIIPIALIYKHYRLFCRNSGKKRLGIIQFSNILIEYIPRRRNGNYRGFLLESSIEILKEKFQLQNIKQISKNRIQNDLHQRSETKIKKRFQQKKERLAKQKAEKEARSRQKQRKIPSP